MPENDIAELFDIIYQAVQDLPDLTRRLTAAKDLLPLLPTRTGPFVHRCFLMGSLPS